MKRKVTHKYFGDYEITIGVPMEEAYQIIKQYNGKELSQYKRPNACGDITVIPYLLSDGRVLEVNPADASVMSSLKAYLAGIDLTTKHLLTTYPKKRINYLPNTGKIYYHEISHLEGKRLTILYDIIDRTEYPYRSWWDPVIYRLHDGEILEHPVGDRHFYYLYRENDYKKLQKKRSIITQIGLDRLNGTQPEYGFIDMNMCGRNPYGEQFPNYVDELAVQLPELLHFSENIMTYDLTSLRYIDKYFYLNLFTDEFADKVFLPLLAYIGKSYIKRNGGEWVMRYDKTFTSWTPDVRDEKGFKDMYRPLLKVLDSTEGHWTPLAVVYNHRPRR